MIGIMTAAGKGTRMGVPATMPKVLIDLDGIPVIAHGINAMRSIGIKEIFIIANTGNKEQFEVALKDYDVNITYIDNSQHVMDSLDHLCRYVLKHPKYNNEHVLYWLADNVFIGGDWKEKVMELKDEVSRVDVPSTGLLLIETNSPKDFITMKKDGSFEDKPKNPETNRSAVGVFVMNNLTIQNTSARVKNEGINEYTIWDSWIKYHHLISRDINSIWIDVGTPERLEFARFALKEYKF